MHRLGDHWRFNDFALHAKPFSSRKEEDIRFCLTLCCPEICFGSSLGTIDPPRCLVALLAKDLDAAGRISEKTIYVSADDTRLQVLAHEIGHSVVDYYFLQVRPPYNIHELMAQFAEQHVTD